MNNINHENYEAYVLDYLEGRLNNEESDALKKFLLLHPEFDIDLEMELPAIENDALFFSAKESIKRYFTAIEENILEYLENKLPAQKRLKFENKLKKDALLASELKAYQKTILPVEQELVFEFKNKLYKQHELILNFKALNYLEGELNNEESLAFERELAMNTALAVEFALFRKTKLSADTSIVFDNKTSLKKEALVIPLFNARVVFSAAAAIVFVVCFGFLLNYFLNPNVPPKNSSLVTMDSKNTEGAKTPVEKNPSPPIHKQSPIAKEKLAFKEDKTIKTLSSVSHLTNKEEVLAQNKTPLDSTSGINANYDNNKALANENEPKTLSEAEIEELQKLEYTYMIPFEEDEESESFEDKNKKNRRFWNFATRLAKRANQLGIKSINGNEDESNHFLLTFNAVTIEKK